MEILLPYIQNEIIYTSEHIGNELIFIDDNRDLLFALNKLNCFDFEYFNKMHRLEHNLKKYGFHNMDQLSCKVLEMFSVYLHEKSDHTVYIHSSCVDSITALFNYYEKCRNIHFNYDFSQSNNINYESYSIIFYYSREHSLRHSDEYSHMNTLISEITNIIKYLQQNGTLIIKVLTFFETRTLYFIYHLCIYFSSVKYYKPEVSSHLDAGGFLICDGYLGEFIYKDRSDKTDMFSKFILSMTPIIKEINKNLIDEIIYIVEHSEYFIGYTKNQSDKYCIKWIKKYFNIEDNSCIKKLLC